jgi:hypothetical protein
VAKWLAATHADPLREIQKSVNTTLAHSFTRSCWQRDGDARAQGRFQRFGEQTKAAMLLKRDG